MAAKLGRAKTDKILEERYGPDWRTIQAKQAAKFSAVKRKYLYQNDITFRNKMESVRLAAVESARSPESNKKRKQTFAKNKHQQGSNNSNFGKMWISNHELQISKPHPKCDPIPEGWVKGRKLNW